MSGGDLAGKVRRICDRLVKPNKRQVLPEFYRKRPVKADKLRKDVKRALEREALDASIERMKIMSGFTQAPEWMKDDVSRRGRSRARG